MKYRLEKRTKVGTCETKYYPQCKGENPFASWKYILFHDDKFILLDTVKTGGFDVRADAEAMCRQYKYFLNGVHVQYEISHEVVSV